VPILSKSIVQIVIVIELNSIKRFCFCTYASLVTGFSIKNVKKSNRIWFPHSFYNSFQVVRETSVLTSSLFTF